MENKDIQDDSISMFERFLFITSFLTILPVRLNKQYDLSLIGSSFYLFPVVGFLIGGLSIVAGFISLYLFESPVHIVIALAAGSFITGCLHLDGLADTFDALLSWKDRDQKLKIMKDSRVGAMGAIALIFVILLKITALISLQENWWIGCLLAPMFGRLGNAYGITKFPPAKSDGLAFNVIPNSSPSSVNKAILISFVLSFIFLKLYTIFLILICFLVINFIGKQIVKVFGGITGDVCGLFSEVTEITTLLFIAYIFN